jgi:hypothetical protein
MYHNNPTADWSDDEASDEDFMPAAASSPSAPTTPTPSVPAFAPSAYVAANPFAASYSAPYDAVAVAERALVRVALASLAPSLARWLIPRVFFGLRLPSCLTRIAHHHNPCVQMDKLAWSSSQLSQSKAIGESRELTKVPSSIATTSCVFPKTPLAGTTATAALFP